ncbi:VOC family protein [Legionella israelensis]|uniref:VOC family protein n=1 Tax=Legionella israelensis TaxID=454 RepID=UPI001C8F3813|nr:VOC family protein [Legionella israelensis]
MKKRSWLSFDQLYRIHVKIGDNLSLSINCTTIEQTDKLFNALSSDGKVTMPLADTFWGAYFGMLIDKYGFHWMLNCPRDSAASK